MLFLTTFSLFSLFVSNILNDYENFTEANLVHQLLLIISNQNDTYCDYNAILRPVPVKCMN